MLRLFRSRSKIPGAKRGSSASTPRAAERTRAQGPRAALISPALRARLSAVGTVGGKAAVGLFFVTLGAGWVLGRAPLERYVSSLHQAPAEVRFNWPVTAGVSKEPRARDPRETWLPAPVRTELVEIASRHATQDPFDQTSLERMRADLLATGWFARVRSVTRDAQGCLNVVGDWRLPTALVKRDGRQWLVARGGELLRLPPRSPVAAGTLPLISAPHLSAPTRDGEPAYGDQWPGGDVQAALDLLRAVQSIPEARRLKGVDLAQYMSKGHLVLVTDAGSRIVWGSAVGESAPGEVSFEKRRGRLRDILAQRYDVEQPSIAIYTPVVLVDTTNAEQ